MDWAKIPNLPQPIKTTQSDVVISGHGGFSIDAVAGSPDSQTRVPPGAELWLLGPPATSLADRLGGALEHGDTIRKLALHSTRKSELTPTLPFRYPPGTLAPNYVLYPPDGLTLRPGVPHVIGVSEPSALSELWVRVRLFLRPGRIISVFWAACTTLPGAGNPVVVYQ